MPETIISILPLLRAEGYEVLSLSGGEPLLYPGFESVVQEAVALGFRVNLISNGAPLGGKILNVVAKYVNLIAISLDGAPKLHAELRGDMRAFVRAERACDRLLEKGVRYGLAYCVSRESLVDMPWAVEFAARKGASLVQFHPFAATGRGRRLAARLSLDEPDKARAYVAAALLQDEQGPAIQIDLVPVEAVRSRRSDYAILNLEHVHTTLLSDLINPLVIDELGRVLPLSYGIDPQFALGQIESNFAVAVARYKAEGYRDLGTLLDVSFARLDSQDTQFVDWFYHVVETIHALQGNVKVTT